MRTPFPSVPVALRACSRLARERFALMAASFVFNLNILSCRFLFPAGGAQKTGPVSRAGHLLRGHESDAFFCPQVSAHSGSEVPPHFSNLLFP